MTVCVLDICQTYEKEVSCSELPAICLAGYRILVWDASQHKTTCHTSLCSLVILVLQMGQLYGDKVAAVQLKDDTRIFSPEYQQIAENAFVTAMFQT